MNRMDLAIKEFRKLREKDEDATLTQMAQAWLNLAMVRKLSILKNNINHYVSLIVNEFYK